MSLIPVVRVALPTPVRRLFDYRAALPGLFPGAMQPGMRVRVPFGSRRLDGVVMEVADASEIPDDRLKSVLELLDTTPIVDAATLSLLNWAAEYYHHPIGEVLAAALPKALRMGVAVDPVEERWLLTQAGREAAATGEPGRAPRQRQLLAALLPHPAGATAAELDQQLPSWRPAARALIERGWVVARATVVADTESAPAATGEAAVSAGPQPN